MITGANGVVGKEIVYELSKNKSCQLLLLSNSKISDVSVVPVGDSFNKNIQRLKKIGITHVGVHLTLVGSEHSITRPSLLTDNNGIFFINRYIVLLKILLNVLSIKKQKIKIKHLQKYFQSGHQILSRDLVKIILYLYYPLLQCIHQVIILNMHLIVLNKKFEEGLIQLVK